MTLREWMLFAMLAVAGACIVRGVALISDPAAWIVAGVAVAALAFLVLTDVTTGDGE